MTAAQRPGWLTLWLLKVAGADEDVILARCGKRELYLQQTGAIAILTTSAVAGCSAWLALRTIFGHSGVGVTALAVLWAFIIMNLDRTIFLSFAQSSEDFAEVAFIKRFLAPLLMRLPLAVGLAMVIAVPLELVVFEPEISASIEQSRRSGAEERAGKMTAAADDWMRQTRKEQEESARIVASLTAQYDETSNELVTESRAREVEVHVAIDENGERRTSQTKVMTRAHTHLLARLSSLRERLETANVELRKREERAEQARLERAKLIATLRHDEETVVAAAVGLPTRFATLEAMKQSNAAFWEMSWAIRLLFVLIELIPAFTRVFGGSSYDAALEKPRLQEARGS